MTPTRVQRSRKAGAKQPEGTRYCGRGTRYGNDYKVHEVVIKGLPTMWYVKNDITGFMSHPIASEELVHIKSVEMFDVQFQINIGGDPAYYDALLGFEHLSCFCPLHLACHLDPIIEHLKRREIELRTQ